MLESWLEGMIPAWTGGVDPTSVRRLTLVGRKPDRATMLIFATSSSQPSIVVKVAGSGEVGRLGHEFWVLEELTRLCPSGPLALVPAPLGRYEGADGCAMASEYVEGRRMKSLFGRRGSRLDPERVAELVNIVRETSSKLASLGGSQAPWQDVFEEPLESLSSNAFERDPALVQRLKKNFEEVDISVKTSWQHGDVNTGNILLTRGGPVYVDWEDGAPDYPEWYDLASVPLNLVRSVALARSLPISTPMVTEILGSQSEVGCCVRDGLVNGWKWEVPIGLAMATAALIEAARRPWAGDVEPPSLLFIRALLPSADGRNCLDWASWR